METRWKFTITTVAIAIPAFLLGGGSPQGEGMWRAIWPWDMEMGSDPSGSQVPFLMFVGALEAVALGAAVSFLAFGRDWVRAVVGRAATGFSIAVAWLLGNWWMHDSLHIVNGENFNGLIVIEYLFHVTLIAAGAYAVWVMARQAKAMAPARAATKAAPLTRGG